MPSLDREQILAMKRQLEEEFRMDMAAIERLERRFVHSAHPKESAPPAAVLPPSNVSVLESRTVAATRQEPRPEPPAQPEPDELEGTLRSMFSSYRK